MFYLLIKITVPRYDIWVNPNHFEIRIKPQYRQTDLKAIAHAVWNSKNIGTYDFLLPVKFDQSLHSIGKAGVQKLMDTYDSSSIIKKFHTQKYVKLISKTTP